MHRTSVLRTYEDTAFGLKMLVEIIVFTSISTMLVATIFFEGVFRSMSVLTILPVANVIKTFLSVF